MPGDPFIERNTLMQLGMGPLAVLISESITELLSGPQEELKWSIAPLQTKIK